MADRHEIRCVKKTNRFDPHERIEQIGGMNADGGSWRLPQQGAIDGIEAGKWSFFVKVGGKSVDVIVANSRYGHKYIKTVADGDQPNNLLSLPECK